MTGMSSCHTSFLILDLELPEANKAACPPDIAVSYTSHHSFARVGGLGPDMRVGCPTSIGHRLTNGTSQTKEDFKRNQTSAWPRIYAAPYRVWCGAESAKTCLKVVHGLPEFNWHYAGSVAPLPWYISHSQLQFWHCWFVTLRGSLDRDRNFCNFSSWTCAKTVFESDWTASWRSRLWEPSDFRGFFLFLMSIPWHKNTINAR